MHSRLFPRRIRMAFNPVEIMAALSCILGARRTDASAFLPLAGGVPLLPRRKPGGTGPRGEEARRSQEFPNVKVTRLATDEKR